MATGDWSVTLRDDTPWRVTDLCDPDQVGYASLVVAPVRIPDGAATAARVWSSGMYSGVLRRQSQRLVLSGPGTVWWAGGEDGSGDWEWTWTDAAVTFSAAVASLSARYLAVFGVPVPFRSWTVPGGTIAGTRSPTSTSGTLRQKMDYLVSLWTDVQWRSDGRGGIEFADQYGLYGLFGPLGPSFAAAMLGPFADGIEAGFPGFNARTTAAKHLEQYATAIGVENGGAATYATLTTSYRNPVGDLARVTRHLSSPQTVAGDLASVAAAELDLVDTFAWSVDVSIVSAYAPADTIKCGAQVWLADDAQGLFGLPADRFFWRGELVCPVLARVVGHQWPIEDGMGVYLLWQTGASSTTVIDLSDWVEWEPPGSRMTVGLPDLDLATVVAQRQMRI